MTLALLATACTKASTFVCADASDCADGSFSGTCQANGYCSFDDDVCPSGQRYGDLAGDDLAGECVELEGTTGTSPTTSGGDSVTLATLEGASLEQSSLDTGSLDDTTTTSVASTGSAVDDTSTSSPTSLTDSDPTMEGSSTGSGTCLGMEGVGECDACGYDLCCDEILACFMERQCACYYECAEEMMMVDMCAELCGPSIAYDALNMCIVVNCGAQCTGM
jgi:hypothetical protein